MTTALVPSSTNDWPLISNFAEADVHLVPDSPFYEWSVGVPAKLKLYKFLQQVEAPQAWAILPLVQGYYFFDTAGASLQNKIELGVSNSATQTLVDKQLAGEPLWSRFGARAEFMLARLADLGHRFQTIAYSNDGTLVLDLGRPDRSLTLIFSADDTQALFRRSAEVFDISVPSLGLFPTDAEIATVAHEFKVAKEWPTANRNRWKRTHSSVDAFLESQLMPSS